MSTIQPYYHSRIDNSQNQIQVEALESTHVEICPRFYRPKSMYGAPTPKGIHKGRGGGYTEDPGQPISPTSTFFCSFDLFQARLHRSPKPTSPPNPVTLRNNRHCEKATSLKLPTRHLTPLQSIICSSPACISLLWDLVQ